MDFSGASIFNKDYIFPSNALRRVISGFTDVAVVICETNHGDVALTSVPTERQTSAIWRHPVLPATSPGRMQKLESIPLTGNDIESLNQAAGLQGTLHKGCNWKAFSCTFQVGLRDRIALQLDRDQDVSFIRRFLEKIWSVLREDCLTEARDMQITFGDDAMLWMISDKIDVAILVLDARSRMLRINLAASELLDAGRILRRGRGGVFACTEQESRKFRSEVSACAMAEDPGESETILFLEGGQHGNRVPVSLSRFYHLGKPSELVVAMLPMPPDPARVEMMGRKMGLSTCEAKVAALMQLGLTNREAARQAGLKEQTFNTYAKRVLNKLNVAGRTEMAQLLTWQAAGRRIA